MLYPLSNGEETSKNEKRRRKTFVRGKIPTTMIIIIITKGIQSRNPRSYSPESIFPKFGKRREKTKLKKKKKEPKSQPIKQIIGFFISVRSRRIIGSRISLSLSLSFPRLTHPRGRRITSWESCKWYIRRVPPHLSFLPSSRGDRPPLAARALVLVSRRIRPCRRLEPRPCRSPPRTTSGRRERWRSPARGTERRGGAAVVTCSPVYR